MVDLKSYITSARNNARDSRETRKARNAKNREAFMAMQDFSDKIDGQSKEFLPRTSSAIHQLKSVFRKGLIGQSSWFSLDLPLSARQILTPTDLQKLLSYYLGCLYCGGTQKWDQFDVVMSDAIWLGLLESLSIVKVGGHMVRELGGAYWYPTIKVIPFEDYYADPTGEGLWEIHETDVDLYQVLELAEAGIYDRDAVSQLVGQSQEKDETDKRDDRDRAQNEVEPHKNRKRVTLTEFWGTILDDDGTPVHQNVVCTIANQQHVIRPPEPNPFWHGTSPFVASPLIRIPFSATHRALMDDAVDINFSQNLLYNLMLDGGIGSVWGIRQVRLDALEDPGAVEGGIPQGATLAVKSSLPPNAKVIEQVTESEIPQDAFSLFQILDREFASAALTTEVNLGRIPKGDVLATEVNEAQQGSNTTLDGIVKDVEAKLIEPILYKTLMNLLQHRGDLNSDVVINQVGIDSAFKLMQLDEDKLRRAFDPALIRVHGISESLTRARDFQKQGAFWQIVTSNPLLFQASAKMLSPEKAVRSLLKSLDIDPTTLALDEMELELLPERLEEMAKMAEYLPGKGQRGASAQVGQQTAQPNAQTVAQSNQLANPTSGLTQNK